MTDRPAVTNNAALSRFEMEVDGGTAVALYRASPGVLAIYHTEVPRHLRERGIASQLLTGALDLMRKEGLKVMPACGFVRHFLATHPQYDDLRG